MTKPEGAQVGAGEAGAARMAADSANRREQGVTIGLEACVARPPAVLNGARFGLLMNQASVDERFRYACDALAERFPGRLQAIFAPQHGLWGEQQANMVESPHGRHAAHDVPVYSLYSDTRRPGPAMLKGLDAFVIDLVDVGTRVYTFAWTVSHCLEACAAADVPVVVLDRPNPLGGVAVEGPLLEPEYESFVGRLAIPMRHGLTLGELARLINVERGIAADLHVVPLTEWHRSMLLADSGRAWVAPSPNLPTPASALVYPGQVLLEGTNLSEGRGTTTPFEVCGAPYVEPFALAEALQRCELPGVRFRLLRFVPTFDKWAGQSCGGVFLHVTEPAAFRPYRTSVALLAAVRRLWPDEFRWSDPPYEYDHERPPIDLITGSDRLRRTLDAGSDLDPAGLDSLCGLDERAWNERAGRVRLYAAASEEYALERIVSGGQTGVDRAALDVALELGIACGGWCPRGRLAEDGPIPARYPLDETPARKYAERTEWNVRDSDGTLILTIGPLAGGTALTKTCAERLGKPLFVVDLSADADVPAVGTWMRRNAIRVLNVAGPRESQQAGISGRAAEFLRQLLVSAGPRTIADRC